MRFKDFIAKIHPLPRPVKLTPVVLFKRDKLGRPLDWSQVPKGTPVYWYTNQWGDVATRRTEHKRSGTFIRYTPVDAHDGYINKWPIRVEGSDGNIMTFTTNELRVL